MNYARWILTLLFVLAIAAGASGIVDDSGRHYTEQGLKRALVAFAAARALNGVISVAQGTEIAIEPVGVGVTLTPGELLDPINDLVERFSWVLLASGTALGVQRVLLAAAAAPLFSGLVYAVVCVALILLWLQAALPTAARRVVLRAALVLLVVRFTVPLMALSSNAFYSAFLAPEYEQSKQLLQHSTQTLSELQSAPEDEQEQNLSFVERVRRAYLSTSASFSVEAKITRLKQASDRIAEHVVSLIVVFVIQTLLFPLLFLYLSIHLIRFIVR